MCRECEIMFKLIRNKFRKSKALIKNKFRKTKVHIYSRVCKITCTHIHFPKLSEGSFVGPPLEFIKIARLDVLPKY